MPEALDSVGTGPSSTDDKGAVVQIIAIALALNLSRPQRMYVRDGAIHGDCAISTVRALTRKGLFRLVIDSPNGQCGLMRLTPLGEVVRALLTSEASPPVPPVGEGFMPTEPNQGAA
jgi:uncharacterized protein YjhX (UPF0386 family)